ncbi:hypothetical protein F9L07_15280 [Pimelobacter simplex]|uniref:Uncharacterized protein n=1 Tax=Nocardioides simplex TaxID=2045 RepID=A0A7J5E4C7_NOCSI|nr:S-4TM family putative pore-forming effector [Pimelobacter simplex]KAB2813055.1 hypothetical protein F9L07_15280 [Pimelobacter simplex]
MPEIRAAQNATENLRLQAAARRLYSRTKLLDGLGLTFSLALALAAPVIASMSDRAGLWVAALAGVWLFASRLVLAPIARRVQRSAAGVQDSFDAAVLGTPCGRSLATPVSGEEIHAATREVDLDRYRNWYPAESTSTWPLSVALCQRANAVWARRQHRLYGRLLTGATVAVTALGITVAITNAQSLQTYLAVILLPSLPLLLDASELAGAHRAAARKRGAIEAALDEFCRAPDPATASDTVSAAQRDLLELRSRGPLVPDWLYRLVAPRYDDDMRFAARSATTP